MKKNVLLFLVLIFTLFGACSPSEEEISIQMTQIAQEVLATQATFITPAPTLGVGSTRLSEKDGMFMVYIPGSEYTIGSNQTEIAIAQEQCGNKCSQSEFENELSKQVVFIDSFWIDQTEVTNDMFTKFVKETNYQTTAEKTLNGFIKGLRTKGFTWTWQLNWQNPDNLDSTIQDIGTHPVVQISWLDAWAYCKWAGKRLPTEAEWESASRGPESLVFPWGNELPSESTDNLADKNLSEANWRNANINDGWQHTSPVSNYPDGVSFFNVFGMAGNAREWVYDGFTSGLKEYSQKINPVNLENPEIRIIRGGSWHTVQTTGRASTRNSAPVYFSANDLGFRCVSSDIQLPDPPNSIHYQDLILMSPEIDIFPSPNTTDVTGKVNNENLKDLKIIGYYDGGEWLKVQSPEVNEGWVGGWFQRQKFVITKSIDLMEEIYIRPENGTALLSNPDEGLVYRQSDDPDKTYFGLMKGYGILKINNPLDEDVYITLQGNNDYGWYVHANSSITANKIVDGSYKVYFTSGMNWVQYLHRFRNATSYFQLEEELVFETNFPSYTEWSLSLEKIEGGNMPSVPIDPDQFP